MRTPQQDSNLDKLIAGLERLPADYGNLYMEAFAIDPLDAAQSTPEHPCGAPACIIGHGPSLGIPLAETFMSEGMMGVEVDWDGYSEEAFGYDDPHDGEGDWSFCFGSNWPDDIPEAIARLKLARDHNIPDEWDYDDRFVSPS